MTNPSPFADSVYAQPGLTHQVRQFDRAPLTAESILSAVASPSPQAVAAEEASLQRAVATGNGSGNGLTPPGAGATANVDEYANWFDSVSITRNYTG